MSFIALAGVDTFLLYSSFQFMVYNVFMFVSIYPNDNANDKNVCHKPREREFWDFWMSR